MIKIIIITALIIYISIGIFLYLTQRNFLYFPTKNIQHTEKNIYLKNEVGKIQIISINEDKKPAIIYFGGNAESVIKSIDYIKKQFPEYAIYMMSYRGYGDSSGNPTEEGIFKDSLILYDYIKEKHTEINVGGRSLGSGVAAYLASKRKVKKLALITPFSSITDIASKKYPIYPVSILLKDKYDTYSRIKEIDAEITLFIADNDGLIPETSLNKLIKNLPINSKTIYIKDSNHITISESNIYFKKMQDFINNHSL